VYKRQVKEQIKNLSTGELLLFQPANKPGEASFRIF
jgi:hypothetical protein